MSAATRPRPPRPGHRQREGARRGRRWPEGARRGRWSPEGPRRSGPPDPKNEREEPHPRTDPHGTPPEPPADLRLVAPALATWLAAAVALTAPAGAVALATAGCVAAGLVLCFLRVRGGRAGPSAAVVPGRFAAGARGGVCGVVAATLLCAGAAAGVAGLDAAGLRRGPLPALAARHGHATVELTLTGDPRRGRPRVLGTSQAPPSVVIEAEAGRVTEAGRTTAVRTPVLLVVDSGPSTGRWLRLLPSTGLTLAVRVVPVTEPGDRLAVVLRATGPPKVTRPPTAVQRVAGVLRADLRTATDQLPQDARGLLPGLVVGDTSRVTPDLQEAFEATDLAHILAVSGSNLTILLALLVGPPALATRAERKGVAARLGLPLRATAVLGGLLTVGFVVLCRPEPSVLRAAACGLITLLAIGTGRRRALLPALAAAVTGLVLYDPWLARSYGFGLSALATAALLVVAPGWREALIRRRVPHHLAEALAAAAAAQVCCAPLVVVIAAHVSLVAIPCNLLAELAVAPATVLGFAALAAAPLSMAAARSLAWLAGWPAGWVAAVARQGAELPGAGVDWPGGWAGGLLLAAATCAALPLARRALRRPWACGALVVLLVVAVARPAPLTRLTTGWPPRDWRLAACDVGQGDALVLNAGAGSAVVVDSGPDPAAVGGCLRDLGVGTIPLLVLTHYHADHVAGLPGVLSGRRVGAIETTGLERPAAEAAFVRRLAGAAHVPLLRAVAGERRRIGDVSWQVLWPPASVDELPGDDPNDASVAMLVRTGGLSVMLLGDLEPDAQRELLARDPNLPQVDVLKVAHHGSAYQDPGLLRRLHPRLALISVGAGNTYGHPAPRTVTALRSEGAVVLRTDTEGPIAVTGDRPEDLRVVTEGRGA
ncbi:ComEC/Rec2 family competence protein [Streptomyces sp. PTM05]|uniref:ComEC/Rec2 family competence protein n=1 Tax=Streptantibioticus parmotrematis TaxID=2873249 RepID=A0ABS7QZT9_9ACTN|nr:ComEC/Rec2 family competence protein [Streptantibioticus parmotrematis]MBY8887820.1 ComEC/Rec2 family competence protein [Streptantibioticus parmotrematis]